VFNRVTRLKIIYKKSIYQNNHKEKMYNISIRKKLKNIQNYYRMNIEKMSVKTPQTNYLVRGRKEGVS
jgi:hypothetical protein